MSIRDLWFFCPLPPDWALNAWLGFAGKWNICGAGGIGIRSLGPGSPGDSYPQRGSEDDQCRPWLNGAPVPWDDFWARCLAAQEPPEGREWVGDWSPTKPGQWMSPPMSARDSLEGVQRIVSESLAYQRWHRPIAKPSPKPGYYWARKSEAHPWRLADVGPVTMDVYGLSGVPVSQSPADWEIGPRLLPPGEEVGTEPAPKAPPAPPVGVWLRRPANEEETIAHARAHGCDEGYGWWAMVLEAGAVCIGGWNGACGMPLTLDAAPAQDAEHAAELAERRREIEGLRRAETLGQMIEEVQVAGYTVLDVGGRPVERSESETGTQEREVCEQPRQSSDPFPEGLVALAQREACASPRITLAPESVVTLTDEDRRELDALAAKVGIRTSDEGEAFEALRREGEREAGKWAALDGVDDLVLGNAEDGVTVHVGSDYIGRVCLHGGIWGYACDGGQYFEDNIDRFEEALTTLLMAKGVL